MQIINNKINKQLTHKSIMKKIFALTAIAALVLSACAKIEKVNTPSEDDAIVFSAYAGRNDNVTTKAAPIGTVADLATAGGFGVFAYYTQSTAYASANVEANFMWNQNVTSSDNGVNWTYSPIKYWPNNDSNTTNGSATWTDYVSFFAYAPFTAVASANKATGTTGNSVGITKVTGNATTKNTENPTITYVVATNPANSVDFLYNDTDNKDLQKPSVSSKISFNFKHALTRLGFTVEGVFDETSAGDNEVESGTKIFVTSLSVTKTPGVSTGGTFDLATKTWTPSGSYAPLAVSAANIPNALKTGGTGVTTTPVSLLNTNEYFMLLPDSAAATYSINIVYDVVTTDEWLKEGTSTVTNNITKTASIKLEQGKAYTIALQLGMTSVKMTASVTDWVDGAADPIWLPINQ